MTNVKPPDAPHRDTFLDNRKEVLRLLQIHTQISGQGPGYKHNVEVLNKSAIVLLVATWESFIEELATNSFDYLLQNCKSHHAIPAKVLASSVRGIKDSKNELDVWQLAGSGWIDVLKKHKEDVIKKYVRSLNTPRTSNVDELFESLLGIKNISNNWRWSGMSKEKSVAKLEQLIETRGEIAHAVRTSKSITKTAVKDCESFLNKLAMITHNRCSEYLHKKCGTKPWTAYRIGTIR